MQRQGLRQEGQGTAQPKDGFGGTSPASFLQPLRTLCRRILVVTSDPEFGRGALEFAGKRGVQARVTGFERALAEVERARAHGLVVLVDCADFGRGCGILEQIKAREVFAIPLTNPNPTEEQRKRLDEIGACPALFERNFDGGRDAGHWLDIMLQYR